jgi:hypothetical protein
MLRDLRTSDILRASEEALFRSYKEIDDRDSESVIEEMLLEKSLRALKRLDMNIFIHCHTFNSVLMNE